jgi:hypothetical protein
MHTHVITHECITHPHTKTIDPPLADVIDRSCRKFTQLINMNEKQEAAKTEINRLAIELIALVNQKAAYTDAEISKIREISQQIHYESNDLNDYEQLFA